MLIVIVKTYLLLGLFVLLADCKIKLNNFI